VVDLRIKFGLGDPKYDKFSVIVVVNVRDKITGLVVDAVSDVLSIAKDDIQPPPDFGSQITVQVMNGIARSADKLVILLDLERALDVDRSQLDALGAMRSES
jgi:purine-binding chemotaxis protein CheW